MQWTLLTPTDAGFFWVRLPPETWVHVSDPDIVFITVDTHGEPFAHSTALCESVLVFPVGTLWAGPILPPDDSEGI